MTKLVMLLALTFGFTFISCSKKATDALSSAPVEGTITFSSVTGTSMTISWPAATSSISSASALQYELVYSTSNISTLTGAQSATVGLAFATATLTANVTGLSPATTYYFAVLVKDTDGNIGYSTGSTSTLCSGKIMFVVNNAGTGGGLGGSSGADTICNSNKPSGFSSSTFRALLTDTNRRACYISGNDSCLPSTTTGRLNWALAASTVYCTSDYSGYIGTSTSSAYLSPNSGVLATTSTNFFTGMNISWGNSISNNCSNWTSTGAASPVMGDAYTGSTGFIASGGTVSCNTTSNLVCVEQ